MWRGKYKDFLSFDFTSKPVRISIPPKPGEYKDGGFFTWGCKNNDRKTALEKMTKTVLEMLDQKTCL